MEKGGKIKGIVQRSRVAWQIHKQSETCEQMEEPPPTSNTAYLVVAPPAGMLRQGHCRVRRQQDTHHPGKRSWVGHSQDGAGCTVWPLECAGLHSSSVHP